MSRVMLIFALAPALAPMVGAGLLALAGWRAIFFFLTLFGVALAWMIWRFLPETLADEDRQPLHPLSLVRAYLAIFRHPAFMLLALGVALNFTGFFLYVLSAPVFILEHLGLGSGGFVWLFGPAMGGLMVGSTLSEHMAGRWSAVRTVGFGFALMFAAVVANAAVSGLLVPGVPASVLPIGLASGMGMFSALGLCARLAWRRLGVRGHPAGEEVA